MTPREELALKWAPQLGPQTALITLVSMSAHELQTKSGGRIHEVFYGGARGGGKSDGALGAFGIHALEYGVGASGLIVRRTSKQLEDIAKRGRQIYCPHWAEFKSSKDQYKFQFHNGAELRLRHLESAQDAENYQGHSYSMILIEELTNFPDPGPVMLLKGCLRSAVGVPTWFIATGNPGGPGHEWVKARYITPAPAGREPIYDEAGMARVFIPARVWDNKVLLNNHPDYVLNLRQVGSKELVRAWLDGDWDAIQGAYFDNWRAEAHMIRPFELPPGQILGRAFDWGSASPFCCLWFAVSDGTYGLPRGALIIYREWYGAKETGVGGYVGLKMRNETIARGIVNREVGEDIRIQVADPSIFKQDGGQSIAEVMHKATKGKVSWLKADNERIAGWQQVRSRLDGFDGQPMLYVFSNCSHLIRTLPSLQHDQKRYEDLDTEAEDHAADALRYACMSRAWTPKGKWVEPPRFTRTFAEEMRNVIRSSQRSRSRSGRRWAS